MRLSEFTLHDFGIKIERDGIFDSLGLLSQNIKNRLIYIEDEESIQFIKDTNNGISCVIAPQELAYLLPPHVGVAVSDNPLISFYLLHNHMAQTGSSVQFTPKRYVSKDAKIHKTAFVDTDVQIADGCIIHPYATVLNGTVLKEDVVIGPGCVVGSEGFKGVRMETGYIPITYLGGVIVEEGVEIQSNTCIERGVFKESTIIGEQTKIDNLVHIAHDIRIGKRCMIVASANIGSGVVIGDDVWVGPNASISDNCIIGDSARITLGAVVTENVPASVTVSGNFAIEHSKFIKFLKSIR